MLTKVKDLDLVKNIWFYGSDEMRSIKFVYVPFVKDKENFINAINIEEENLVLNESNEIDKDLLDF